MVQKKRLWSYLFTFWILFFSMGYTLPSFALSRPENLVLVYNQPVNYEDAGAVMKRICNGQGTAVLTPNRFSVRSSVWIFIPEKAMAKGKKFLLTGFQDYIDVYKFKDGTWQKIRRGGKFARFSSLSIATNRYYVQVYDDTDQDSGKGILVACRKYTNYNFTTLSASLSSYEELHNWYSGYRLNHNRYPGIILPFFGMLFTTVLLLAVKYILSGDQAYGFHAFGLILFLTFFVLVYLEHPLNIDDSFFDDPRLLIHLDKFFLFLSICCLLFSIRFFYNHGKYFELNNRVTNYLAGFSALIALAVLVISYTTEEFYLINNACMALAVLITMPLGLHWLRIRNEIRGAFRIIVIGLCCLTASVYTGFILVIWAKDNRWGFGLEQLLAVPMLLGIGINNCFSVIALANRDHQIQQEAINLRGRAYEAEMAVVQKGLNPHFIFNCLNLIDSFLYNNNNKAARKTLFKFGDLLRMVIDKSPERLILLSDELKMLDLYLKLENSRLDNSFLYSIDVENVDAELCMIPPLLIQPIVENAIKHGIRNLDNTVGEIRVHVAKSSDLMLEITVDDNGVGRGVSRKMQTKSYSKTGHMGLQLTTKRLEIMADMHMVEARIEVQDKGDHIGTLVKIRFPVIKS